ncbi:MAG: metallophosphoesterase family protein [Planctomycetes bacterium]|nr:metallophosphoesterase family protein [Planctomycetota bacterium]MBM4086489.1 metallophosphoesterase family protein [Planctomycetota bacterium]
MKILVLSDIHANLTALQAIQEDYDHLICLGDLVDYGPQPRECIEWVRQRVPRIVRGNHDNAVGHRVDCRCSEKFKPLSVATREYTWSVLNADETGYLARLPLTDRFELDGMRFLAVHATPSDPLFCYLAADEKLWAHEVAAVQADFILVGHTHRPFVLKCGQKSVLNPGSVGQPRDGDPCASYALIRDSHVELKRVEYPVEATIAALMQTGLAGQAVSQLAHVLRTGGRCM